jgi:DNA-directed RNA polymerase specialized sigma subunit
MIKKMTQEQQNLVIRNYRLLQNFIESRDERGLVPECLRDDFMSDMAWCFCNSAIKFEAARGFKFSTYAYGGFHICCSNMKGRTLPSYQKNNFTTQRKLKSISRHIVVDNKHIDEESLLNLIDKANLTWREDTILREYYLEGENMAAIGRSFKVTRARIFQVIKKALRKLQFRVEKEHLILEDFYEYQ